jgi:deazaflavin-dependent oxidoreductase (nitroreductase family)
LIYIKDGADFVVVASNGGSERDPAWWLNLKTKPEAEVQAGTQRFEARATQAAAEDRERLWPLLVAVYGGYDGYQAKTSRRIPLVVLKDVTPL